MKCTCLRKCQIRNDFGRALLYIPGDVDEFEECPPNFRPIANGGEIDFIFASEHELMQCNWRFVKAQEAIKEEFDIELRYEEGMLKSDIVKQILDARFRGEA